MELAGFPFAAITLDKDGDRVEPIEPIMPDGTTDLIVISHGWKNDEGDAKALYAELLKNVHELMEETGRLADRKIAVAGVFWPAFRFKEDLSIVRDDLGSPALGGAAAAGNSDVPTSALQAEAEAVAVMLGLDADSFMNSAVDAKGGGGAADRFLAELRAALSKDADTDTIAEHGDLVSGVSGRDLVETLKHGQTFEAAKVDPKAQGSAAGFGSGIGQVGARLLAGGKAAVASILNQATYYEMKARSGKVGQAVARILDDEVTEGVRVHLVGHSFGARLVTSVASSLTQVRPVSLSLLQGAFSHNGLGRDIGTNKVPGGFRNIIDDKKVDGPILITHTHNDSAVGFFYAVASQVSGEIAKGIGLDKIIGGPKDLHGGIGANGAQSLAEDEATALIFTREVPATLLRSGINNVRVDAIVTGHNDVRNKDVARLVADAIG